MPPKKAVVSRGEKKTVAKTVPKNWIVLTSDCGNANQAKHYSTHATEAQAKVAAAKAGAEKDYYGNNAKYKAVFVAKLSGKITTTIQTAYADI